jgi:dolichol-phosphate mannosyltransferase/undecaprenyl-phosphate 4-deoxy-4-formamido-L-arabinose transferase
MAELTSGIRDRSQPEVEFSVVIPVYNSEKTLASLVERISAVFNRIGRSYEIVLVDDGSRDGSWKLIQQMHAQGAPLRAFRLMRNHGQHYALKCGLDNCVGRFAITMDDDLQHPPEEIPKLIEALDTDPEVDVVIGKYDSKKHSAYRNFGTWILDATRRIVFRVDPRLTMSSFRIMNRVVLDELCKVRHANPRIGFIILSLTSRVKNTPVHHEPRSEGRSSYTLRKLISNTLDSIISYSPLPLRFVSYLGIFSASISMLLALYFLLLYFLGKIQVSGFMTTTLLILFTGGVIMFSFGLVGEYLSRIISQQLMHDQYSIRTVLTPLKPAAGDDPVDEIT